MRRLPAVLVAHCECKLVDALHESKDFADCICMQKSETTLRVRHVCLDSHSEWMPKNNVLVLKFRRLPRYKHLMRLSCGALQLSKV
jgi:hypothetical protein